MKEISRERLIKDARRVLENTFWIPEISVDETYTRIQDDHDGTFCGQLSVNFIRDSDAWVFTDEHIHAMRFRSFFEGGQSPRVRNALMILAYAIKLDNEDKSQKKDI